MKFAFFLTRSSYSHLLCVFGALKCGCSPRLRVQSVHGTVRVLEVLFGGQAKCPQNSFEHGGNHVGTILELMEETM